METSKCPLMGEKKSKASSNLATFESFRDWRSLRMTKVIPNGAYFVAGLLGDKKNNVVDIVPDIFIQGYRPHSSDGTFSGDKRRYGRMFVGCNEPEKLEFKDDMYLRDGNLYRAISDDGFGLIFFNGEWLIKANVEKLFTEICQELSLEVLSRCKRFWMTPSESCGYFLKGKKYPVLSLLVGSNEPMAGVKKKVLALDLNSGIPGLLNYYNPEDFERMPKEKGAVIDDRFIVDGDNLLRK